MPTISSKTASSPRLGAVLRELKDSADLKPSTVAVAFACSDDTARRMFNGDHDDNFADINHALRTLPASAGDALANVLLSGTAYQVSRDGHDLSVDFNHDGRVDTRDGTDGVVGAVNEIAGLIQEFRTAEGHGARTYTSEQGASLLVKLDGVERVMSRLRKLVNQLTAVPVVR